MDMGGKEVRIGTDTEQSYFPMQAKGTAVKKQRRQRPVGMDQPVFQEMRKLQKTTELMIRKAPFGRL
jgi:hypothetical protein